MRDNIPRKQQTLRGELKKEEKMRAGLHMSKKSKQIFVVLSTSSPKGTLRKYSRTFVQIASIFR